MKFTAIICEFNPLTKGHEYIIQEAKRITKRPLICLMSGNFVQRGEPAILDKYTRASHAIKAGADLVIELPTIYSLSSAPDFAFGAIKTLNAIGCVENLVFGSECGNLELLIKEAESSQTSSEIRLKLNQGMSYASAISSSSDILSSPNNVLGVEYIKALKSTNSKIKPITIKRENNYNNTTLSNLSSATALRKLLKEENYEQFKENAPLYSTEDVSAYCYSTTIEKLIEYKIKSMNMIDISKINGTSEGVEFRIVERLNCCGDIKKRIDEIKTKRYPESKIKRILINCLLDIKKEDVVLAKNNHSEYLKILAINKNQTRLLSSLPQELVVTGKKDYLKLNEFSKKIIDFDMQASKVYSCIKDDYSALSDYTTGMKKI